MDLQIPKEEDSLYLNAAVLQKSEVFVSLIY